MADSSERAPPPTGVAILSDAPLGDASRDYFGFRVYAEAIASLIDNELTDTPLTIALSAPWGGGKTSVAKMVRRRLAERSAARGHDRPVLACWFGAWMHNDADHLGAALATAVARTADAGRPAWRRLVSPVPAALMAPRLRARRRLIVALVLAVVAALVVLITPLKEPVGDLLGVELEGKGGAAAQALTFALLGLLVARSVFRVADDAARFVANPGAESSSGSMAQVKEQLGRLIDQGRRGGRLVIYVDDLERCAPARALEVCEVASQLLSHEGVVTLLIADMQAVAAAADEHYPDQGNEMGGAGRRFLEKIVQIQVVLPPPHREHIRRLLRGDAPDTAFVGAPAVPALPPSPHETAPGLTAAVATDIEAATWFMQALVVVLPVPALLVAFDAWDASTGIVVTALIGAPLAILTAIRGYLAWRARGARKEARAIRETIRSAVSDQLPPDEIEHRVLAGRERYESLALDLLESFRLDHTPELQRVAGVVIQYPPARPRSAKRMLNHARLLTQIGRDRGIFGAVPELTPEHLGAWIVLEERWPEIAARIAEQPLLMADLERADDVDAVAAVLARNGVNMPAVPDDLVALLEHAPRLSEVVSRLVHFEPAAAWRSRDAEVLGIDRRP
jgi:hypothetical protein